MRCKSLKTSISDSSDKELVAIVPTRKRVISDCIETFSENSPFKTPRKNKLNSVSTINESLLETLPQDILIKILSSVNHEDLDQLFHVSNKIKEASVIAKQNHFAFSTPSSKTSTLKVFSDLQEDSSEFESVEAPNAPKQDRSYKSRIKGRKLAAITIALFRSTEEEEWSKNGLVLESVV